MLPFGSNVEKPFLVVFGKYGLEYVMDLEEQERAFQDYTFEKLRRSNASKPRSRLDTILKLMDIHAYKEMQAWAVNIGAEAVQVWDMFEKDYNGMCEKVIECGIKIK